MRLSLCVRIVLLTVVSAPAAAAEPPKLNFAPGQTLKYRIERDLKATTKALGETNTTEATIVLDVAATANEPDADGRIKLSVKTTHVKGVAPAFEGLTQRQVKFDDRLAAAGAIPGSWHFLSAVAMKKHPLHLVYDPRGTIADVQGHEALAAEVDALLGKHFQKHIDFSPTRAIFKQIYSPAVQKALWNDLLIVDLPDNLEPQKEWKEQRLTYIQPFYVWIEATHLPEKTDDGWKFETTCTMPKSKTASVKFEIQEFEYSVKNGEGEETVELDADGTVRRLESTWHVYFDLTAIALGQRTPVDELYQRVKYKIERLE
ncbi:MAG TPA: hypothetical protein VMP01_02420 [Pirellulaceae bacterium]|nr:hypothetical protein [Pirellulaceae bacterium]